MRIISYFRDIHLEAAMDVATKPREGRGTRRRRGKPFTEASGARGSEGRYPDQSRREGFPRYREMNHKYLSLVM